MTKIKNKLKDIKGIIKLCLFPIVTISILTKVAILHPMPFLIPLSYFLGFIWAFPMLYEVIKPQKEDNKDE